MMEKLQQDSESQQATIAELHGQLSRGAELNATLEAQLQEVRNQVNQLQEERVSLVDESRRVGDENSDLRAKYKSQEELLCALTEQVERSVTGMVDWNDSVPVPQEIFPHTHKLPWQCCASMHQMWIVQKVQKVK